MVAQSIDYVSPDHQEVGVMGRALLKGTSPPRGHLTSIWEKDVEEEEEKDKARVTFSHLVGLVSQWFGSWSDCERAVLLYSLVKQLAPTQSCFLRSLIDHTTPLTPSLTELQAQANSAAWVKGLCETNKGEAVTQLLSHLPLLKPENTEAKAAYLALLQQVLQHSVQHGAQVEGSKQLLSFALIHPAISPAERSSLSHWLPVLEQATSSGVASTNGSSHAGVGIGHQGAPPRITPGHVLAAQQAALIHEQAAMAQAALGLPAALQPVVLAPNGSLVPGLPAQQWQPQQRQHVQLRAMASAPPGYGAHGPRYRNQPRSHPKLRKAVTEWLDGAPEPPIGSRQVRSNSLHGRVPHSPEHSGNNSGSDTLEAENKTLFNKPGMKEVPSWLKSLRLHKYQHIFQSLAYPDMTSVKEEALERQGVTQGARKKILQSIAKLNERHETLSKLEQELSEAESMEHALAELKGVLGTPMVLFTPPEEGEAREAVKEVEGEEQDGEGEDKIWEGDLAGHFTRVMGKVCNKLLTANQGDEECISYFHMLIDESLQKEAFTEKNRKLLLSWKQSVQKLWGILPRRQSFKSRELRNSLGGFGGRAAVSRTSSGPHPQRRGAGHYNGHLPLTRNASLGAQFLHAPHAVVEQEIVKQALTRTRSAPTQRQLRPVTGNRDYSEGGVAAQLESLCVSVIDHAIGGNDASDGPVTSTAL